MALPSRRRRHQLHADRSRALPVNDPDHRELFISCGAALPNLRVAARHYGFLASPDLLPDPADDWLCARLTLSEGGPETPDEAMLYAAITRRRTYRKPFAERVVPDDCPQRIRQAAEAEDTWLRRGQMTALPGWPPVQALQHVLLVLATDGILAAYANQPSQVGDPLRARLRDALPNLSGHPQLLLQAGYPSAAASPTPRRPIADVLDA